LPVRSLHLLGHLSRQFPSIYRSTRTPLFSTFFLLNLIVLGLLRAKRAGVTAEGSGINEL
jgi:hypothetical protein